MDIEHAERSISSLVRKEEIPRLARDGTWGLAQIFKTASVLVLCPPAERKLEITKLVLSGALHLVLLA
jgi:hypothetical protein